jgi:predicted RNA-binding Zn-ribbon protein involved in translation (DUF1610 family)
LFNVIEALPKLQKQFMFQKAVKLSIKILKNKDVPCPVCGKLMIYNGRQHKLECRNPKCSLIGIRVFKNGTLRVLRQPRRMRP